MGSVKLPVNIMNHMSAEVTADNISFSSTNNDSVDMSGIFNDNDVIIRTTW